MSYENLLVERCDVYRRTNSVDQYGHKVQSFPAAPIYTNVPCRQDKIGNFTSTLAQTATGQTSRNEFCLFVKKDADIRSGDRIVKDGVSYTVTPSLNLFNHSSLHHKEIFISIEET